MADSRNTPASNAEAQIRFRDAMKLVEHAQHTLERAAQMLSPIVGAAPHNTRIYRMSIRVHDLWRFLAYRVRGAGKPNKWFMDNMCADNEAPRVLVAKRQPQPTNNSDRENA